MSGKYGIGKVYDRHHARLKADSVDEYKEALKEAEAAIQRAMNEGGPEASGSITQMTHEESTDFFTRAFGFSKERAAAFDMELRQRGKPAKEDKFDGGDFEEWVVEDDE